MNKQAAETLIRRFQNDIIRDDGHQFLAEHRHSLSVKYGRSEAAREIRESAPEVLPFIAAHLATYRQLSEYGGIENEMKVAWCWLLRQIREQNTFGPEDPNNTFAIWVDWAKSYSSAVETNA